MPNSGDFLDRVGCVPTLLLLAGATPVQCHDEASRDEVAPHALQLEASSLRNRL